MQQRKSKKRIKLDTDYREYTPLEVRMKQQLTGDFSSPKKNYDKTIGTMRAPTMSSKDKSGGPSGI